MKVKVFGRVDSQTHLNRVKLLLNPGWQEMDLTKDQFETIKTYYLNLLTFAIPDKRIPLSGEPEKKEPVVGDLKEEKIESKSDEGVGNQDDGKAAQGEQKSTQKQPVVGKKGLKSVESK